MQTKRTAGFRTTLAFAVLVFGGASAVFAPTGWGERSAAALGGSAIHPQAPIGARRGAGPDTELLLNLIAMWLSENFDLPQKYDRPRVEFVPAGHITALRLGALQSSSQREVVAVYLDERKTIYLAESWTGKTPAELSILVHEMVHHLQNLGERTFLCPEARERLAYDAQEKWLEMFGRNLLQDFEIDPVTRKLSTACM